MPAKLNDEKSQVRLNDTLTKQIYKFVLVFHQPEIDDLLNLGIQPDYVTRQCIICLCPYKA